MAKEASVVLWYCKFVILAATNDCQLNRLQSHKQNIYFWLLEKENILC